jgi:hypothetical protein
VAVSPAQWRSVVEPLLPESAAWAFRRRTTYRQPVGWLLLGIHGDASGLLKDHLYVHSLYMPLFVPTEHLVLSHGRRAAAAPLSELAPAVKQALRDLPDERAGLKRIAARDSEAGRYALVLMGKPREAARAMGKPFFPDDERPFVEEERKRIAFVRALLDREGGDGAVAQLGVWRRQTLEALGIGEA